jgi:hypothetical protein
VRSVPGRNEPAEGFDPETGEWLEGFDEQRATWEEEYAKAPGGN